MRTIKFRGQTVDTKIWVYGDYCQNEPYVSTGVFQSIRTEPYTSFKVKSETVGQFTGLTDKNGVEIYEGDFLKVEIFSKPYQVSFGKSERWGACFCVQSYNSITFLNKMWADTCEVIGNIHENPELL